MAVASALRRVEQSRYERVLLMEFEDSKHFLLIIIIIIEDRGKLIISCVPETPEDATNNNQRTGAALFRGLPYDCD